MLKTKKLEFIVMLILLMILSVCMAFSFNSKQEVYAAESLVSGTFEMEDGVSLKLNEDGGMRFIVKMSDDVKEYIVDNDTTDEVSLGFVIAKTSKITEIKDGDGNYRSLTNNMAEVIETKIYKDGEFWYANGCITNMYEQNREFDYSAVAFIKNGENVQYTPYNDNARNNLYYTSQYALLHGYTSDVLSLESYSWLGKGDFPLVVSDSSEYDLVVDKVNAGYDFSAFNLKVENDAEPTKAYTENKVPFVNGTKKIDLSSAELDNATWAQASDLEVEQTGMTGEVYKFTTTTDSDKLDAGDGVKVQISGLMTFDGSVAFDLYIPAEYMANNVICLNVGGQLVNLKYEEDGITYVRSNNTYVKTIIADEVLTVVIDLDVLGARSDNQFTFSCGAGINEYYVSNMALYSEYDVSNLQKAILMQDFTGIAPLYLTWEKATNQELTATGMSGDVIKYTTLAATYPNAPVHRMLDGLNTPDKLLVFDLYIQSKNDGSMILIFGATDEQGTNGISINMTANENKAKYYKQDGTVLYEVVEGELLKVVIDLDALQSAGGKNFSTDRFDILATTANFVAYIGNIEFVDSYPAG